MYCSDRCSWGWKQCSHFHQKLMSCLMLLIDFGSSKLSTAWRMVFPIRCVSKVHSTSRSYTETCSQTTEYTAIHSPTKSWCVPWDPQRDVLLLWPLNLHKWEKKNVQFHKAGAKGEMRANYRQTALPLLAAPVLFACREVREYLKIRRKIAISLCK